MASAAEQMAANLSWGTFGKAKDLQSRILFAVGLLIVYRIGTYIPVPGVDAARLRSSSSSRRRPRRHAQHVHRRRRRADGDLLARDHALHLGLDHRAAPRLDGAEPAGAEEGRRERAARRSTSTPATARSSSRPSRPTASPSASRPRAWRTIPGWYFRLGVIITLVGGTMFLMWLGEQITARGIGNGISLIIFTGIVANMPHALAQFLTQGRTGAISPAVIVGIMVMVVAVVAFVVFMERALRKIHIQYPKRQVGMKIYGGESSNLPVKVNPAGVIPAIFASSLLLLPATITTFSGQSAGAGGIMALHRRLHGPGPAAAHAVLRRADRLLHLLLHRQRRLQVRRRRRQPQAPGRLHPRHPAGPEDDRVSRLRRHPHPRHRLGLPDRGLPACPRSSSPSFSVPFYFGGTSLLIVVSVTMDTITQIQSHMLAHQYEGLIEKSRLRGKGRGKPRR